MILKSEIIVNNCFFFHRWQTVKDGFTKYEKCKDCSARRISQVEGYGYQPINYNWLWLHLSLESELSKNEILSKIDLAIRANGGETWKKEWCQCEPEVGIIICEYCAMFEGLRVAKKYIVEGRCK